MSEARRALVPDHRDPDAFAGLTQRRRERGLPVGLIEPDEDRECLGHPAEDCGPEGEGCAIGSVLYCDGSCRGGR